MTAAPVWSCAAMGFRYPAAARHALSAVTLELREGAFTAILGPNGSGKSTLLRLFLGVLSPTEGEVVFRGAPIAGWSREEMALEVGVVAQGEEMAFPARARELVAMGRYPHLGPWRREGPEDRRAVAEAMRRCDVAELAERPFATLSGGERQRVRLARALAQEPRALALDEPSASLDVGHEMAIFELLRTLATERVTVVIVTHNVNLAARYADDLILLDRGRVVGAGRPAEVLTRERVEEVYGWPARIVPHPGPGADTAAPQVIPLAAEVLGRSSEGSWRRYDHAIGSESKLPSDSPRGEKESDDDARLLP